MLGCLLAAFYLCNPNYVPQGAYAYSGGYAQSGYYQQYVQAPPVYVVQQPVYYAQPVYAQPAPYYGGGYNNYPFAGMGGVSVAVGPRGGVRVGVGR